MFPLFYQNCFQANLSPAQYLTLEILVHLLQSYRTVQLERLSALFPQPITFESGRRNLQRFLKLPQLSVKLLWFPLIKQIIKQEFSQKNKNRHQRKKLKKTQNFFSNVHHTQTHKLGSFNLASRWKRPYRGQKMKDPWYLLTNLNTLEKTLRFFTK